MLLASWLGKTFGTCREEQRAQPTGTEVIHSPVTSTYLDPALLLVKFMSFHYYLRKAPQWENLTVQRQTVYAR